MNKAYIIKKILEIQDELQRLNHMLSALYQIDIEQFPDNYYSMSYEAALRSEEITCRLRNLVISANGSLKTDYHKNSMVSHKILVEENQGILSIRMPTLLPKKKQGQGKFLIDPLFTAFSEFINNNNSSKYWPLEDCVIYIACVYPYEVPKNFIRDYDNIEMKQVVDAITAFFIVDDNGSCVNIHLATEVDSESCTKIFLMPKAVFPLWIKMHLTTVQTVSHLQ